MLKNLYANKKSLSGIGKVSSVHFVATDCKDSYNDDYFIEDTLENFLGSKKNWKLLKYIEISTNDT